MNNVVMYSGGVDSFLTHFYLKSKKIDHELLYFFMGTKYSCYENNLFSSEDFKKYIDIPVSVSSVLNLGSLEHDDAYVPNRNILAAIASHSVTDYSNIWIGGTLSDRVNDNNELLFQMLSEVMSEVHGKTITITSAFWHDHKASLVKSFVDNNGWGSFSNKLIAKKALVHSTFSCYYPVNCDDHQIAVYYFDNSGYKDIEFNKPEFIMTHECEKCPACFRKNFSLYAGGIFIPMSYCDETLKIINKYFNEATEYIKKIEGDNPFVDTAMLPRMRYTVDYVKALKYFWKEIQHVC